MKAEIDFDLLPLHLKTIAIVEKGLEVAKNIMAMKEAQKKQKLIQSLVSTTVILPK